MIYMGKKSILGLYLFFATTISFGQNASQEKLIAQERRPKIEDIMSNLPENLAPFGMVRSGIVAEIGRNLPALIVALEKAFPGGTYAFLGRDMDLVADAVEAFYQSIGQKNRVQRIEFSTPSLIGSTPEIITDYLTQKGLDSKGDTLKPIFIIIDYTTYSSIGQNDSSFPSQARHLFQSVISQMKQNGLSALDIVSRINVATLDSRAKKGSISLNNPLVDGSSDLLKDQASGLSSEGHVNKITYLPVSGDSMCYNSEWTGKYGPIKRGQDNTLYTSPISFFRQEDKREVFLQIISAIKEVLSEATQRQIMDLASIHGVKFDQIVKQGLQVKKEEQVKPVKINYEVQLKNEIKKNLSSLKDLPVEKQYSKFTVNNSNIKLTENGNLVVKILSSKDALLAAHYFEISLETLIELYDQKKIGVRDFRRIFSYILSLKKIEKTEFISMVTNNYKKILPLEIMLGREEERTKYEAQGGVAEENYRTLISAGRLKLSCKFAYSTD